MDTPALRRGHQTDFPFVMQWLATLALLTLTTAGVGCGQWIDAEDYRPGSGAEVVAFGGDRLRHTQLAGVVEGFAIVGTDPDDTVLFDYGALAGDEARFALEGYRQLLASVDPSGLADGKERLAFWINAYNALVIHSVLARSGGDPTFRTNADPLFFSEPRFGFGGPAPGSTEPRVVLGLDQLEHGVIRGDWVHPSVAPSDEQTMALLRDWHQQLWNGGAVDARVHAALNCAALSCPDLLARPPFVYLADQVEQQLATAVTQWLQNPQKGAGPEGISSLFQWFAGDFERQAGSVAEFIRTHRPGGLEGVVTDRFLPYDWTLNLGTRSGDRSR